MATTHIHEITQELTSLNLDGSELLVVSNPHGAGFTDYETNKLSINSLKDFINDGTSSSNSHSTCGYEIYDLSGPDYIENVVTMTAGTTNEANPWSHTFSQDCEVWVSLDTTTHQYIKIDGIPISTNLLSWGIESKPNSFRKFYVKKNQTLTISVSCTVMIYPLKSGGNYFIDTNIPLEAPFTQYEQFGTSSSLYNFRFEANRKTLLVWCTGVAGATGGINSYSLNGKSIQYYVYRTESGLGTSSAVSETSVYDRLVLDAGDVVTFSTKATTNQHYSFGFYCAYPLIDSGSDTMDSVQLWEGGPYWATKNIGAKRDIDFGEYFQYGSLNGYRYENKVYVGNGSDNYEFPTNDSLVYGKSREQLLQAGIITEDNVLTPNYDAATQKFGSEWKIPSYDDWIALNSYCDMYWTRKNGVEGVMITGRNAYSDKSIFLPNAGEAGSNGPTDQIRYSSTKVSYGPTTYQAANAECAYFTNSGQSEQVFVQAIRSVQDGLPIRPIKVVS